MATLPLIINNFDRAIADSPHKGFGLMKLVDLDAYPGAVKNGFKMTTLFHTAYARAFTADAGTDICTETSGLTPATSTAVYLTTTGTLPAGLAINTVYFVSKVTATTFKLSTTIANANAGTGINITDAGTGTHTMTTIAPGQINHFVKDPRSGMVFAQDSNGRVWYGTTLFQLLYDSGLDTGTAALSNASGNGLALSAFSSTTSTYLFSFRNAKIDVINVYGTTQLETPSWTDNWQSLNTAAGASNRHHAILAQDNIIYFTDSRYVGSIKENSGSTFDPASGATYTYNNQALDMPPYEVCNHLEELGINLLISGNTFNKIYPWDRTSDSFNLPLEVPESAVKRLKNIGGIVYILAGTWGNIYTTQGSYVQFFKKIPQQITNNSDSIQSSPIEWGGIGKKNGNLLFGMSVQTSGNSGAYMLYPDGRLVLDQIPTTGSASVTAFEDSSNFYKIGYSGGADTHDIDRYASFEGIVQSEFFKVATITQKATYSVLEVIIAKPASTGAVRVGYRTNTSGSFTTIDTFTADGSSTTFKNDAIGLIDIENIQIQLEIDDDVEVVEVRLLE